MFREDFSPKNKSLSWVADYPEMIDSIKMVIEKNHNVKIMLETQFTGYTEDKTGFKVESTQLFGNSTHKCSNLILALPQKPSKN